MPRLYTFVDYAGEEVSMDDSGLRVAIAARLSWFAPTYTMDACTIEADAILALVSAEYRPLLERAREALVSYRGGYPWYLDETGNAKLLAEVEAKLGVKP